MVLICLCLFQLLLPVNVLGQENEIVHRIETVDGNVFIGTIISENTEALVINTTGLGEITIQRSNIKTMEEVDADRIKTGVYWFENPHSTRYFFAPTAMGLRDDQGYYQNTWILFNNANYGLTDNFSMGAGFIPMFLFGISETPIWLLPKFSIPMAQENIHLSVGALTGIVTGTGADGTFGILYGTVTFGSQDRNLTTGLGYGYAGSNWSQTPMLNISGMIRTGRTIYIITENYLFPGVEDFLGFGSLGVRWAPENIAIDFALARTFSEGEGYIGIPWLGLSIPFKR